MTKIWENFEKTCVDYLNNKFKQYAQFTWQGKSDSTKSDIEVITKNGKRFYIEAKHCPAQCGQFVLLPNIETKTFDYSRLNVSPINPYSLTIISVMNKDFESYKEAGTKGKSIEFINSSKIFANWIKNYYKNKDTRFIITNNFEIFSIDDIENIFDISATYRIKRSGSGSVGNSKINIVKQFIKDNYPIDSTHYEQDKLFATSKYDLHNKRFILNSTEYMFSKRENIYEIRKLSNTFNANVIFSIEFNPQINSINNKDFITLLTQ